MGEKDEWQKLVHFSAKESGEHSEDRLAHEGMETLEMKVRTLRLLVHIADSRDTNFFSQLSIGGVYSLHH